eukprot:TRINITY_DN2829_c0_g2_i2.p1 TRINITY_DN2829_c0_g2~~TRINITY_DN2829_c0_g2_i2.p1  ORF type:complete len:521 (+),score=112.66 TRINITY_DN2829_c0_g2_i2:145-1563(+)
MKDSCKRLQDIKTKEAGEMKSITKLADFAEAERVEKEEDIFKQRREIIDNGEEAKKPTNEKTKSTAFQSRQSSAKRTSFTSLTKPFSMIVAFIAMLTFFVGSSPVSGQPNKSGGEEVITFFGNPGAGKSALLNILVQDVVFHSGLDVTGLTKEMQHHHYQGDIYIDTPGLADPLRREQAAAQIEASLKMSKNYKIIFVARANSARISAADLETINTVCKMITTKFTYGLILNQLTPADEKKLMDDAKLLKTLLGQLHQAPSATLMIPRIVELEDAENVLSTDKSIRTKLSNFIESLEANMIPEANVEPIDVRSFDERAKEIETKLQAALEEHQKKEQILQEQLRIQAAATEQSRQQEEMLKEQLRVQAEEAAKQKKIDEERWLNGVKTIDPEFKKELGAQQRRKIRENRKRIWRRDTVWDIMQIYAPFTEYTRNKITKNNGEVEYTEWKVFRTGEDIIGEDEVNKRYENELF